MKRVVQSTLRLIAGGTNSWSARSTIREFATIASEEVVAHGRTWDMSDFLPLKDFQTGTVFVQLIDVHYSKVLFQGEFALNIDPLSITPLFEK